MNGKEFLDIIGNVASIVTVIGGGYGFCKWIKSFKAKIVVVDYENDSPFHYIHIVNKGLAAAYEIRLCNVESAQVIDQLLPGEAGQLSFASRMPASRSTVKISWRDGMGNHKKRVRID